MFIYSAVRNDRNKRRKQKQQTQLLETIVPLDDVVSPAEENLISKIVNAHLETFPLLQEDTKHILVSEYGEG